MAFKFLIFFFVFSQEVLSFAPLHLVRLEFRLDESTFIHYIKEIEKEIATEQNALTKSQSVDDILARNKVSLSSGHLCW